MPNYDATKVGVPYVRSPVITINWPDNNNTPFAIITQQTAVLLADGSVRTLDTLEPLQFTLNMANGDAPIPVLSPADGSPLGTNTSLNQIMVQIFSVIRQQQLARDLAATTTP